MKIMRCLICNSRHWKFDRLKEHIEKTHSVGEMIECIAGNYL